VNSYTFTTSDANWTNQQTSNFTVGNDTTIGTGNAVTWAPTAAFGAFGVQAIPSGAKTLGVGQTLTFSMDFHCAEEAATKAVATARRIFERIFMNFSEVVRNLR
jgi:hypothetical protein